MTIKTVIFPVAGLGTRFLPVTKSIPKELLPVVDVPLIQLAVEEAVEAGCERFIFVTGRGKGAIEDHFDHAVELERSLEAHGKRDELTQLSRLIRTPGSVQYIRQQEPAGLGHAVWCARHVVGDEPVAVILPDDVIKAPQGCLRQMVDRYEGGNMIAVMEVEEEVVSRYGIVTPGAQEGRLVDVRGLVEKPSLAEAPSRLAVIGRYIIEPEVFQVLGHTARGRQGELQLTDSLAQRVGFAPFKGYLFEGERFDCGSKLGHLQANVAFALDRPELGDALRGWLSAVL